MKAASYSDAHPDIKALKQKIVGLEKLIGKKTPDTTAAATEVGVGVDAFERQYDSIKANLEGISKKLAAARLGENLERGQHSERLSVIEQPTLPQTPERPNRPKILAAVFALAIAAGGGLVFALEMFDGTIRRNADIAKLIDSQLIVSIPYISTKAEVLRQKSRKIRLAIGCSVGVVLAGIGSGYLPFAEIWSDLACYLRGCCLEGGYNRVRSRRAAPIGLRGPDGTHQTGR